MEKQFSGFSVKEYREKHQYVFPLMLSYTDTVYKLEFNRLVRCTLNNAAFVLDVSYGEIKLFRRFMRKVLSVA